MDCHDSRSAACATSMRLFRKLISSPFFSLDGDSASTISGVSSSGRGKVAGSSPGIALARITVRTGPGLSRLTFTLVPLAFGGIGKRQRFQRRLGHGIAAPERRVLARRAGGDEQRAAGIGLAQQADRANGSAANWR